MAKSNILKTSKFESCPCFIKLYIRPWGFFISHSNYTFFTPKIFRLKFLATLQRRILKNVTKFQLLGDYMVAAPSCHLALVWSLRVNACRTYLHNNTSGSWRWPVEVPFVISNIPKYQYTIKRSEQFAAGAILTTDNLKTLPYSQNKMSKRHSSCT